MKILELDHLVLTVASIDATVAFYCGMLGMERETFGPDGRTTLRFGRQKVNLHQSDNMFEPKALVPTRGSADLCFIVDDFAAIEATLARHGVPILVPDSMRVGTHGDIRSIYVRDPDGNLVELSTYDTGVVRPS